MTAFATGEGITAAVGAAADTTAGALDGVVAGAGQVAGVTEKLWDPRTCTPPHASSTTATGTSTSHAPTGMAWRRSSKPRHPAAAISALFAPSIHILVCISRSCDLVTRSGSAPLTDTPSRTPTVSRVAVASPSATGVTEWSVITDLAANGQDRDLALVRATIELGQALEMRVVAEGIEDHATFALLASMGCDLAQGFFISRPVPARDLVLPTPHYRLLPETAIAASA